MFAAHLLRNILPLTLLAICACGSNSTNSTLGSTVVRLADGTTNCPSGGQILSYGIDKNGNGTLDDTEVSGSFDVCKGRPGSITKVDQVTAGTQCAAGGVVVQTGVDANGNGTLDASEVTSQTPICSANGAITSVIGSIYVETADQLAFYAGVETISGNFSASVSPGNFNITMPNLRSTGGSVSVYSNNGGGPLLAQDVAPHAQARSRALMPYPGAQGSASFPALVTAGGGLDVSYGLTLSAPALTTVIGPLYCGDQNAVLPLLTSVGEVGNGCGSELLTNQIVDLTGSYYAPNGNTIFNSLVRWAGTSRYTDAGLQLYHYGSLFVSLPNLTDLGFIQGYDNVTSPLVNAPQLQRLGALTQYGGWYGKRGIQLNAPHLTGVLGSVYLANADPNLVTSLHTIGGALAVAGASFNTLNANNLTAAGAIVLRQNSNLTSFAAKNLASMPAWDPNYDAFSSQNPTMPGGIGLDSCIGNVDPSQKLCASVLFQDNYNLHSIDLGALTSIPGILWFANNNGLQTFASSLTSIGSALSFNDPDVGPVNVSLYLQASNLTTLAGFKTITSMPGQLVVVGNSNLTDLGGWSLQGSADTCPVFYDNAKLDYCAVKRFVTLYNTSCTLDTPQALQLSDPCASSSCTGSQQCTVDCTQLTTGYTCQ